MPFCVVKIGGSLMDVSKEIVRRLVAMEDHSFLVVPGGGVLADQVRDLFRRGKISQEAAHWMAILAMEQYARILADGTGAELTREVAEFPSSVRILMPYLALIKDDERIEHSWDYTSDAVAAMVACRLKADLVKVTDVDGVYLDGSVAKEVSAEALLEKQTCVDQGTLLILSRYGGRCLVINGADAKSFVVNLRKRRGGTLIIG